ncbi:TAXI family TRAP transporter solute-binding subunit [bacterium]|nr:TAXI family TRAP transporter solute-binding subunit [bacterium]
MEVRLKPVRTLIAATVIATFAGAVAAQDAKQLVIGTGGTGGVYYPLGGGLANIIGKEIPNTQATAQVTGASVDNLKLIAAGKADIGFTQVDAAWDAIKGQGKFMAPLPVKALTVLYPNHLHAVTVDGTGIAKVEDLKGKRVSVGSAGSATEVFSVRVLEAAGLDADKDIVKEKLGASESVNAMKDRKIDAFFWVGGLPTAAITDLAATPNTTINFLNVDQYGDKMNAKYGPLYSPAVIPKATYKGMTEDAKNLTVWNILAVNENMPEDLAYKLTKLIFDKRDDLGLVHGEGKNIKLESQSVKRSGIPFHKGSLKYFAEKGIKVE